MKNELLKIGIRYNALFIAETKDAVFDNIKIPTANMVANLKKLGYTVSEPLLRQLNQLTAPELLHIYEEFTEVLQVKNNWAPLVKGWDIPTGEKRVHHWMTWIANIFPGASGVRLACGHLIPDNTFPLERYNGCPFCGTPFVTDNDVYKGQGSKLKVLALWTDVDLQGLLMNLLQSKTALDATQMSTLKVLLQYYPLPETNIGMKETQILVIDALKDTGKIKEAGELFTSPNDILRYLWYKHTGFLQLVQPKVIIRRTEKNNKHLHKTLDTAKGSGMEAKEKLKLKYGRGEGKIVAQWLNHLPLPVAKSAELMHPKRAMWVRFIRALRLAEYSHRKGMERLRELLDVFYNETYEVWAGSLEQSRLKYDTHKTFALLQERPGLFARSLFSNMLWFGKDEAIVAFEEIADQLPARLLLTLNNYASLYFNANNKRIVKPLGGTNKAIQPNRLLQLYEEDQLGEMVTAVEGMYVRFMKKRFAAQENRHKTIFIDESLYYMPMPVGDRSETVQDLPAALMGTRFALEGDQVRLFMQWGEGMKAQHLDMDLSCQIAFSDRTDVCSYYNLDTVGAKHSGDIRSIPEKVGTAEYIELDIPALQNAGAHYVSFTCNAYSNGGITPNLIVGWMNSAHAMKISERTGVAYDPSCVQNQVRVTQNLSKGLLFGVLDVAQREVIWLEMQFQGQTIAGLNAKAVTLLLAKLKSKTTVGNLLALKAAAQGLVIVPNEAEADEAYTRTWALDIGGVSQLLVD